MNVLPDIDYEQFLAQQESQFIRPASDFASEVEKRLAEGPSSVGDKLPWLKTHSEFAFRPGEVTLWAGIGGSGKSLMMGQVAMWFPSHVKTLFASLEMPPVATLSRMLRQASGVAQPSKRFQDDFFIATDSRYWIYDQTDSVPSNRILGMCHYAATELGVNHIMIDSLVKCGLALDDYTSQKNFLDRLCWAAKTHKVHIHVVHHLRKGSDPAHIPNGFDLKGAGELRDLTDNLLLVWRNGKKEEARQNGETVDAREPDCLLIVDKQRHGEWKGKYALYFHAASMQFLSDNNPRAMPWRPSRDEQREYGEEF